MNADKLYHRQLWCYTLDYSFSESRGECLKIGSYRIVNAKKLCIIFLVHAKAFLPL